MSFAVYGKAKDTQALDDYEARTGDVVSIAVCPTLEGALDQLRTARGFSHGWVAAPKGDIYDRRGTLVANTRREDMDASGLIASGRVGM